MYRYYIEYDTTGIRVKDIFVSGGASFATPSQFKYNIPVNPSSITTLDIDISTSCPTAGTATTLNIVIGTPPTGVTYDDTDIIITPSAMSLSTFANTIYTLSFDANSGSEFNTCFFYDTDKKIQCQIYDVLYNRCNDIKCEDIECVLLYEALSRVQECDACANVCDLLDCVLACADEDKCNC